MKTTILLCLLSLFGTVHAFADFAETCLVTSGPASGNSVVITFLSNQAVSIKVIGSNGTVSQATSASWTPSGINDVFGGSSFSGILPSESIILSTHPINSSTQFKNQYGFYSEVTSRGIQTSYVSCTLAR